MPIWRSGGRAGRVLAGLAGLAGGLSVWSCAFLVAIDDPTMHSTVVGSIRACAVLASLVLCLIVSRRDQSSRRTIAS
ncbi:hypothetical protein [Allostella humosa]|uniref:hypothetical protein n=1 Tax=Stella humosa TaxID=94 RepID=UPI00114F52D9|nr:hypothetical protein [Stella humosa]